MSNEIALSRRSDLSTSHAAAASLGDVSGLQAMVLRLVRDAGDRGVTLDEVCAATGLDKVTASPRFRPLANKGLIREARHNYGEPIKRLGSSGRSQTVWVAVA